MDSYQKLLAEGVLTEDKVVCCGRGIVLTDKSKLTMGQFTYRLLSRTLRVHPNTAKQYGTFRTE